MALSEFSSDQIVFASMFLSPRLMIDSSSGIIMFSLSSRNCYISLTVPGILRLRSLWFSVYHGCFRLALPSNLCFFPSCNSLVLTHTLHFDLVWAPHWPGSSLLEDTSRRMSPVASEVLYYQGRTQVVTGWPISPSSLCSFFQAMHASLWPWASHNLGGDLRLSGKREEGAQSYKLLSSSTNLESSDHQGLPLGGNVAFSVNNREEYR